jgi:hypothetical protein
MAMDDGQAGWDQFAKEHPEMNVQTLPDGSHVMGDGLGPYDNGLSVRITYPPGMTGVPSIDQGKYKATAQSIDSKGNVVPDPPGSAPGSAATSSGRGSHMPKSPIENAKEAIGLGDPARPQSAAEGSIENPNAAYQTKTNYREGQTLLGYNDEDRAAAGKVTGDQNKLLSDYSATIHDPNASSVAQTQLAQNNDANMRSQLGSAAGVGGANAFAARRQALNNIAVGNIGTAQASAVTRAKEVADAQNASNTLLGSMSAADTSRMGNDLAGASKYSELSAKGAQKADDEEIDAKKKEAEQNQTAFNRVTNVISSGMGSGLGSK